MKMWHLLIALLLLILCGLAVDGQTTRPSRVIYIPKVKGQSKQREDGATRGPGDKGIVAHVITPADEVGVVDSDRPTLYWYLKEPIKYHCDVQVQTLNQDTVFEQELNGVPSAGLISLDLGKGDAKLTPGQLYKFAVFITIDATEPASDYVTSGMIRFDPPTTNAAPAAGNPVDRAATLAANGYFIDAVGLLAKDDTAEGKQALKDLMSQVNLAAPEPAASH